MFAFWTYKSFKSKSLWTEKKFFKIASSQIFLCNASSKLQFFGELTASYRVTYLHQLFGKNWLPIFLLSPMESREFISSIFFVFSFIQIGSSLLSFIQISSSIVAPLFVTRLPSPLRWRSEIMCKSVHVYNKIQTFI